MEEPKLESGLKKQDTKTSPDKDHKKPNLEWWFQKEYDNLENDPEFGIDYDDRPW